MFASILVGTDGSQTASVAVRHAIGLAVELRAKLEIVSAYEPTADERLQLERTQVPTDVEWTVNPRAEVLELLERACSDARDAGVADATSHARQGDAADAILDVAEEQGVDLIVVGNKGMTGAKRFLLGSVPNKVSHHSPCNLLVVDTTSE